MGDWNAVVGEEESGIVIGKYGLGRKNERGKRLIEFCKKNQATLPLPILGSNQHLFPATQEKKIYLEKSMR